ncbi:carbohydrate ABC transporter permease [Paenibacillus algorifonticola]|uniref:Carbohydrate ABC transporter membrane protein 2, CUT1 family (TC 3.A.1.1.-) n=1 Tax=Paenibacillus algorifonticola TaxID=684063 RepID=A0A1I2GW23_9BACL|nr:carbohydrate ABC transporter permease [Paenibacillus algorifonticola]SFF20781.1 carbohydrate ABC transporter membrane protein 2, CUT1 family (TC 3.A.1.1.-) [Paenibacillus algorifonticola]
MKSSVGENIFQFILIAFICGLCTAMIYPFIHIASVSLSGPAESTRMGFHLYPKDIDLFSWKQVVSQQKIWWGFGNSAFRTVVGTLLTLVAMSMVAYPLSRKTLPHRSFYTMIILFTMFFSGGLIPSYLLIKELHLMDSRWVYIIPGLVPTFSMLVLRNFFMSIPQEVEESARIDGANDIRVLVTIVLPLSKPVLATLALWTAVGHWNAWFDAVLYISDQSKQVLQFFLREIVILNADKETFGSTVVGNYKYETSIKAATVMFAVLPILIVYPFLQKYFVKGTMIGSLKG